MPLEDMEEEEEEEEEERLLYLGQYSSLEEVSVGECL